MKRYYRAILLFICLCSPTIAISDVHPPVKVSLQGPPRAAKSGKPFTGQLLITTSTDALLTNMHFEGDGWAQLRLDGASDQPLTQVSGLIVNFTIQSFDAAKPVVFVLEYNGFPVRTTLDLSRTNFERATTVGQLRQTKDSGSILPGRSDQIRPPTGPLPTAETRASDKSGAGVTRIIRVHGRLAYNRPDGVVVGADGATVLVYDEDLLVDDLLASAVTDAYGYYDIYIDTANAGETNPDLYVRFKAQNGPVNVQSPVWGITYTWRSGVHNNFAGSTLNLGTSLPASESLHPALHILTDLTRTWRWLLVNENYATPPVDCDWPEGATGAYYSWNTVHISTEHEWHESTHTHEYGHHWIRHFGGHVAPDYCNGVCDASLTDCGHCMWCQETDHDAFAEGWPNWLADVITRSYLGDYGIASSNFRDQESVQICSIAVGLDDPTKTEGFLGALLRDIEDSTNEDDPNFTYGQDRLSLGTDEIFRITTQFQTATPISFLNSFNAVYPHLREQLWATAANCGYELDFAPPDPITDLISSHATTGDSADPTIHFSWTRPADDASGVVDYLFEIGPSPVANLPYWAPRLGNVTSYTTDVLTPGTYYFSIRPEDARGYKGPTTSYGPFTIRTPGAADLTYAPNPNWDYPLVPRADNTASSGNATVSPLLTGNSNASYWNVRGRNIGQSSTGSAFQTRLYIDNIYTRGWTWNAIGAGGWFYGANGGPFTVKGGRHTFEARFDATNLVAEADETNNVYAHQFIWQPLSLLPEIPVLRTAPPAPTAGWSSVIDGQLLWFNCDGFRPGIPGTWNAITLQPVSNADDYDIRLHQSSTGSENGFASNSAYSAQAAGHLDAVLFNRNVTGSTAYDAGVINPAGGSGDFVVRHVTSTGAVFGDTTSIAFGGDQYLILREFPVSAADTGYVSITFDSDPALGPVHIQWRDDTFATGPLVNANRQAVTDASTGRARLDFHVARSGFNCVALYRDPQDGSAPLVGTLKIQRTPPDLMTYYPAGWHAPLVPRPAADGSPSLVALPDTLHGNAPATYFNLAVHNSSPTGAPSLLGRIYQDGVYTAWVSWGYFRGYSSSKFNGNAAQTIPGGRHLLDLKLDPLQSIEEILETNNGYGEQYVWSPLEVAPGTRITRGTPPDRIGGFDTIASGEPLYYNCDGLRMPAKVSSWQAMAVMPNLGGDVDLRIHPLLQGAKNGFSTSMAYSGWGPSALDFVLVNYHAAPPSGYDFGVLNVTSGGYTADHAISSFLGTDPAGNTNIFSLPAQAMLNLHEVEFINPGSISIGLQATGGSVDWGIAVFGPDSSFTAKSQALVASWLAPAGQNEYLYDVPIATPGFYCLAVWKTNSGELAKDGTYRMTFGSGASDVPEADTPQSTALHDPFPNPFNPTTNIAFRLATPGITEIAIYDLKGSRIRVLSHEPLAAGPHEVQWDGTNNGGQRLASGVYMVRMTAPGFREMKKLILVK